ncbi:hypothetical protein [Streptomyces chilikensis]|uniref:hypothetical protein n=1 Tax=Streptomyces chilikensis TaxID=1194079 RepID=UPI00140861BF|nr:hypothetical protein [Streptomyces chilikensis]
MAPAPPPDPLTAAADEALTALARAARRGLRNLTGAVPADLDRACAGLRRAGLRAAADALAALRDALRAEGPAAAVSAWADATIRLAVTRELHQRSPAPGSETGPRRQARPLRGAEYGVPGGPVTVMILLLVGPAGGSGVPGAGPVSARAPAARPAVRVHVLITAIPRRLRCFRRTNARG